MKKLTLRSLPSSVLPEYTSVSKIVYEKNCCVVHLTAHASNRTVQIIFSDVVGVKILDERDFSEFWRCNMESFDLISPDLQPPVAGSAPRWVDAAVTLKPTR
ncbi:hypothetical protein AB8807_00175 [Xanthomonas campestris pv. olitorii]|nr:hypothetical protein KWH09_00180 [Xanthomonas campestris pv. olitorii]